MFDPRELVLDASEPVDQALHLYVICRSAEPFLADNTNESSFNRESAGRQRLCNLLRLYQASDGRGSVENVKSWCSCSVGRIDDVLILSSDENTVPAPMESVTSASRYLNGAVGDATHVGILIEP